MRPICTIPVVGIIILTGLSFGISGNKLSGRETVADKGFAVVELFTSEGCSSCPPADEAIIQLAKEYPGNVYILGFHVDYWDYIGWKDEYSNAAFTERQRQYAGKFNLNSIYTPQVVINGKKEFVGSNQKLLRSSVKQELQENSSSLLEIKAQRNDNDKINVTCKTKITGETILTIALVQLHASTAVKRGENKGVLLHHINIVRDIKSISAVNTTGSSFSFAVPKSLSAKDLKVIAFLQNKKNLNITGATEITIQ